VTIEILEAEFAQRLSTTKALLGVKLRLHQPARLAAFGDDSVSKVDPLAPGDNTYLFKECSV
jgi:hypothetical protein